MIEVALLPLVCYLHPQQLKVEIKMERSFNAMAHDNMYKMSYTFQRSTPHLFKQVRELRVCKILSAYLKYLSRTYVFIGRICGMGTVKYRTMMSCHVHGEDKFLLRLKRCLCILW